MRLSSVLFFGLIGSTALLAACAQGAVLEGDASEGSAGRVGASGNAGYGGDGAAGDVAAGGDTAAGAAGYGAGGAGASSNTGGGGSGSGGAAGFGGSGGSGGSGVGPCAFEAQNACGSAEQLANISGDEGGTQSASGNTSKWFKVRIKETDDAISESDLSYKVSLTSPPGMDYDLYVRQGPQDGDPNCNAAEKKGMLSGGSEVVTASWDDDQGIGGEDDSLWLSIEVRHVSGDDCNAKWNLVVIGDP